MWLSYDSGVVSCTGQMPLGMKREEDPLMSSWGADSSHKMDPRYEGSGALLYTPRAFEVCKDVDVDEASACLCVED